MNCWLNEEGFLKILIKSIQRNRYNAYNELVYGPILKIYFIFILTWWISFNYFQKTINSTGENSNQTIESLGDSNSSSSYDMERRNVTKKGGQRDNLESSSDNSSLFTIDDGEYERLVIIVENLFWIVIKKNVESIRKSKNKNQTCSVSIYSIRTFTSFEHMRNLRKSY